MVYPCASLPNSVLREVMLVVDNLKLALLRVFIPQKLASTISCYFASVVLFFPLEILFLFSSTALFYFSASHPEHLAASLVWLAISKMLCNQLKGKIRRLMI